MSNPAEAKIDEGKLNSFIGQMLSDLGGASSVALVRLGESGVGQALPPALVWWRDFGVRHVGTVCLHATLAGPCPRTVNATGVHRISTHRNDAAPRALRCHVYADP